MGWLAIQINQSVIDVKYTLVGSSFKKQNIKMCISFYFLLADCCIKNFFFNWLLIFLFVLFLFPGIILVVAVKKKKKKLFKLNFFVLFPGAILVSCCSPAQSILPVARERRDRFIPFSRKLVWSSSALPYTLV